MTDELEMKRKVAIKAMFKKRGYISFWTTPNIATEFAQYGDLHRWEKESNTYTLYVDGRFDFGEVVELLRNYGATQ